jgi:hypothetical protein
VIRYLMLSALSVGAVLLAAPAKPGPGEIVPWQGIFQRVAGPRWVDRAAQVQAESGFNASAQSWIINKQGVRVPCAYGPAQFTMPTWKVWAKPPTSDPHDPSYAIPAQHSYMSFLEAKCGGDFDASCGSYNAGLGSILKAQRLANSLGLPGEQGWLYQALPRVTGPSNAQQTQGYVKHITQNRAHIHALGGRP